MKLYLKVFIFISVLFFFGNVSAETKQANDHIKNSSKSGDVINNEIYNEYILGPGDVLGIEVWRDDSLTRTVVILPDGKISYPLIGEMLAAGNTLPELKKEIALKLSKFINSPSINIEVKQPSSMYIYVLGKVNSPGRFLMTSNINVLQGIATAGGLNSFAKSNDIKIFRQNNDKTEIFKFEYGDVTDGENLDQNIQLRRGDVIIIP